MQRLRSCAHRVLLLAPAALLAQDITTEGTIAVGAGGALLDGDRPAYQRIVQHKKDGYGGIETFRFVREDRDSVLKFEGRALVADDDYRLQLQYQRTERFYVDAGFEQFRVYYDGSGGYFAPTGTAFRVFDEDLSLTRSKLWAEAGVFAPNGTLVRFRYERQERDGTKDSTHWGDTLLLGAFGARNLVPTFYDFNEVTDVFTLDVGNQSQENMSWNVGARYAENKLDNGKFSRRRPTEPTAERILTTRDQTSTDLFAMHGYYLRRINEQLTVSGGALRTKLDTTLAGSRIYGQNYDPVFDPAAVRRQFHDEGYFGLHGGAELKQTVLNLNAAYVPRPHWSIRPSIRFENLHQDAISEFDETAVGNAPLFATEIEEMAGEHRREWNEFSEAVELRYTGKPDWTFSAKADWMQGSGDLEEALVDLHTNTTAIERDVDNERQSQKYSLGTNWYVKPGLTLAAQYYFKGNTNDYDVRRDNTQADSSNRYPSYIANQDFEVHDFNLRLSWRPASVLNLVTRYDRQQSKIFTGGELLAMADGSKLTSHIVSQTATYTPTARLYVTANVNVTYDQMNTPAIAFVQHADNNYINGSIAGGCAVGKIDDVYFDYAWFRANNFIDRSAFTLPYGTSQRTQALYLTWVRRQTDRVIYTMRYGYVTQRDRTWVGLNDFDAHVVYAKVQYTF